VVVKAKPDTPSDIVEKLRQQVNKLQADLSALRTKYNAHLAADGLHYDGAASVTDSTNTADPLTAEQVEKLV